MDLTPYRVKLFNGPSPMNILPTSSPSLQPFKHRIRDVSTPSPNRIRAVSIPLMHRIQTESTRVRWPEEVKTNISGDGNNDSDVDSVHTELIKTVQEMKEMGECIGFAPDEAASRKKDLMLSIDLAMTKAKSALSREKSILQQECDYARQQVKLILSLTGDHDGNELLNSRDRSFIFQCTDDDCENSFNLTLRQLRGSLNLIFLATFRPFIGILRQLITVTLRFHLCQESIGGWTPSQTDNELLANLPTMQEAQGFMSLIHKFESAIDRFDKYSSKINSENEGKPNMSILVSSPRKLNHHDPPSNHGLSISDECLKIISELREVNYGIIRALRVTKLSRISPDIVRSLESVIFQCEEEIDTRSHRMVSTLDYCLSQIDEMDLSDTDISTIQKSHDSNTSNQPSDDASYFDKGTLSFIREHPRQFGFHDQHLNFIENFANMLKQFRESRQSEMDNLAVQCKDLWTRLGEDVTYVERFIDANKKMCQTSLMNYRIELNKLLRKRAESIDRFISDTRNQIELLWQKMFYTCDQQASFKYHDESAMRNVQDKEAILAEHEQELVSLKQEYASKKQILDQYDQLQGLLDDQKFLAESSKDSSRLMSKDSCRILINEEKIRNRVERLLPRLLDAIRRNIAEYDHHAKEKGKETFMIFDRSLSAKVNEMQQQAMPNSGSTRSGRSVLVGRSPIRKSPLARPSPVKGSSRMQGKQILPVRVNIQARAGPYGRSHEHARTILPVRSALKRSLHAPSTQLRPATTRPFPRGESPLHLRHQSATVESSNASSLASPLNSQHRVSPPSTLALSMILQPLNFDSMLGQKQQDRNRNQNQNHSPIPSSPPLRFNKLVDQVNLPPYPTTYPGIADQENRAPMAMNEKKLQKPFVPLARNLNVLATMNADESTLFAEDEYQTWRASRIKQLNGI